MRIPSGVTDQVIYFVAVDATDFTTRETGLSSFTVYRSRDGGSAAAMTTPTVTEVDATNMPGVYKILLDEDMDIGTGNYSEEMVFHITHAGMAPVTRTIELYLDVESIVTSALVANPYPGQLISTTIATLSSQTSFTLTAGSADDGAYNNCIAIITDATTGVQKAYGMVSSYTGSTKTITLDSDPGIFTMAANDLITILTPLTGLIDVRKINGAEVIGDGSEVDKWRGSS